MERAARWMVCVALAASLVTTACGSETTTTVEPEPDPEVTTTTVEPEPAMTTSTVEPEPEPAVTTTTVQPTPSGSWTVRWLNVDGMEFSHPDNAQTLNIMDGTLSANDGCNSWSGSAQWDASRAFSQTGDTISTLRACVGVQDSADAFNVAVRRATQWALTAEGSLVLTSSTSRVELT